MEITTLPLCMSFSAITDGLGHLVYLVLPLDDRHDLSSFEQIFEGKQVRLR